MIGHSPPRHYEPMDAREVARSDDKLRDAARFLPQTLDCLVASFFVMTPR